MSQYYRVLVDGVDIYNPKKRDKLLIHPVVKPSLSGAGCFDFGIDSEHENYNDIVPYGSDIEVLEDGVQIFYGRPLPPSINMYRQKTYHCEGAIAFLNDIILPPMPDTEEEEYEEEGETKTREIPRLISMSEYITYVFQKYNEFQANSSRAIYLGTVQIENDPVMEYNSDFKSCLDILRTEILPYTGGYLIATHSNGSTTIDIRTSLGGTAQQPITAGINLLDLTEAQQNFYTAVVAKGGKPSWSQGEGEQEDGDEEEHDDEPVFTEEPVTMSPSVLARYGVICAYQYFPQCITMEELLAECNNFLSSQQFTKAILDVSAMDLHISNRAYDLLRAGSIVQFESPIPGRQPVNMIVIGMEVNISTGEKRVKLGEHVKTKISEKWRQTPQNNKTKVEQTIKEGSPNAVSSQAVFEALHDLEDEVVEGSEKPVTSDAIYKAIKDADKWKHQVNGETLEEGTVNFITVP